MALHARLHGRRPRGRVDRDLVQRLEVDQHPVADARRRPAVPARAGLDPESRRLRASRTAATTAASVSGGRSASGNRAGFGAEADRAGEAPRSPWSPRRRMRPSSDCRTHVHGRPERGQPEFVRDAARALARQEERGAPRCSAMSTAPSGGMPSAARRGAGLRGVDRRVDREQAGVDPLRPRSSCAASSVIARIAWCAAEARALRRATGARRRVRDLDEAASAVRAKGAGAEREEEERLPRDVGASSARTPSEVCIGDGPPATDDPGPMRAIETASTIASSPPRTLAASVNAASSCAASSTSAPIAWAPRARTASRVSSLCAIAAQSQPSARARSRIAPPRFRAPSVTSFGISARGGLQSRLSCLTVEHELEFYFK